MIILGMFLAVLFVPDMVGDTKGWEFGQERADKVRDKALESRKAPAGSKQRQIQDREEFCKGRTLVLVDNGITITTRLCNDLNIPVSNM